MKKTYEFGKIDYYGIGRRINAVTVDVELRENNGKPVLSICGKIYNTRKGCVTCGQCLDTIAKYLDNNEQFNELYRLWKLYHLNDMNAGTPEQEKAIEDWKAQGNKYDYTNVCEYLKSIGLYEVMHEGKPYKYGHAWVYQEIPSDDLKRIKELVA